jgi:hypothetical protein
MHLKKEPLKDQIFKGGILLVVIGGVLAFVLDVTVGAVMAGVGGVLAIGAKYAD